VLRCNTEFLCGHKKIFDVAVSGETNHSIETALGRYNTDTKDKEITGKNQ